jgi:ArsR family transcriptional regulator, arsenate/arsenite/antimonite-responsive transcriptional repressor
MNAAAQHKEADFSDERLAKLLCALSHPARIRILRHLAGHAACNCKQVVGKVGLAQSTVSQHLKILVEAGLVGYQPHSQQSRFFIAPEALDVLSKSVVRLAGECCAPHQGNLPDGH